MGILRAKVEAHNPEDQIKAEYLAALVNNALLVAPPVWRIEKMTKSQIKKMQENAKG